MPQPRCKCPVRLTQSLAALFVAACGQLCTLRAETNSIVYFLVGTIPWGPAESYVLPLSEPEDIAHARWLIAEDAVNRGGPEDPLPEGSRTIISARVAKGADGINRNYSVRGYPAWSWHVSEFRGFWDYTAEILDGGPSFVENALDQWVESGIGFWGFTVVRELGPFPLYVAAEPQADELIIYWSGVGTNVVYSLESAESPAFTNWVLEASGLPPVKTNQWTMPLPESAERYYRVLVVQPGG